jgi:hypothetical protein
LPEASFSLPQQALSQYQPLDCRLITANSSLCQDDGSFAALQKMPAQGKIAGARQMASSRFV